MSCIAVQATLKDKNLKSLVQYVLYWECPLCGQHVDIASGLTADTIEQLVNDHKIICKPSGQEESG